MSANPGARHTTKARVVFRVPLWRSLDFWLGLPFASTGILACFVLRVGWLSLGAVLFTAFGLLGIARAIRVRVVVDDFGVKKVGYPLCIPWSEIRSVHRHASFGGPYGSPTIVRKNGAINGLETTDPDGLVLEIEKRLEAFRTRI